MTKPITKLFVQSAAIAALLPTAALAELSALDVWEQWKSLAETTGQTITVGSQETGGGALILNNVTMNMAFPEGSAASSLEFIEFRERSDGTVAVSMAPDFPFSITIDPAQGEAVDMAMIMRQSGTSIIASGDPDNISFDYLAADISMSIDKIIVDGEDIDADIQFSMKDIDGKYTLLSGDTKSYDSEFSSGSLTYNVAFTDPEEGGRVTMSATMQDVKSNSSVEFPEGIDMADPSAIFSGDFNVTGGFSAGQTDTQMEMDGGSDSFSLTATGASSSLDFSIVDGSIQYGGAATDINYVIQSPQIPFPEVSLGISEMAFNLLVPLAQSDTPKDFAFLMNMAGFEISDMIWGMFDPGNIMPRDPATITLDVTGKMNLLFDLYDPDFENKSDAETPAELHSLSIRDITLSAVGAEVKGSGDFTFDNDDLETFGGMPAPTGAINMNIVGVNGVMDRLIQMGFLQQDQAMGARMMLGLFARPGDGEDTLTSTIEVKSDGSIFANGQQLR
ncbi:MAG: DUF2125 domain-containing protein [Paracoccaceae bacterium]